MRKQNQKIVRQQPKKDSKSKRINDDNERVSKFDKDNDIKDIKETCASNDVRWYAHNAELLRAAASLPFSNTTGQNLGLAGEVSSNPNVPGVMQMTFIPTIGGWDDNAVNSAKESIYSYVVHANSRNTSYNATDLMLVILAGAQIFMHLGNAIRAYGIMKTYDQRNLYLPKALVNACGFDFEDLQSNLANMWFDINEMIARATQIWIPNTLPVLDRWFWLSSNVYMDSESVKGQYYMFCPDGFLVYNETQSSQGGGLNWLTNAGTIFTSGSSSTIWTNTLQHTWASFKTMMNVLFNALLLSEDRGVIMGDILKAYGADRIYALKPITSDYTVTPVYDKEVLTQIENANEFDSWYFQIQQNANTLQLETNWAFAYTDGTAILGDQVLPDQWILNFHQKEVPSPEQVMVATRLMTLGSKVNPINPTSDKVIAVCPMTMGTEYIRKIQYFYYGVDRALHAASYKTRMLATETTLDLDYFAEMAFDWSPWRARFSAYTLTWGMDLSSWTTPSLFWLFGDFDNYTIIQRDELKKMHTTAVYSEFGVPTIG